MEAENGRKSALDHGFYLMIPANTSKMLPKEFIFKGVSAIPTWIPSPSTSAKEPTR